MTAEVDLVYETFVPDNSIPFDTGMKIVGIVQFNSLFH